MLDPSSPLGLIINNIAQYIFGSSEVIGIWIAILFFGIMAVLRIEFVIGLVAIIPITIIMMAYGLIFPIAGGLIILTVSFITASYFFTK